MGTQKNRLSDTVFLSTQNITFKLMGNYSFTLKSFAQLITVLREQVSNTIKFMGRASYQKTPRNESMTSTLADSGFLKPERRRKGKQFFFLLDQAYIVGTYKNRLNETVILSTQTIFLLMGKNLITILR